MVDACGPVQTDEGAENDVGAHRATNSTAEMQAFIVGLFWLSSWVEHDDLTIFRKVMVTSGFVVRQGDHRREICGEGEQSDGNVALPHVESDSEKAAAPHTKDTEGTLETREIPLLMSWQTWVRVRKHSIDGGSELSRWVTGRNTRLKQRCRVFKEKKTPCEQAHRTRWTGAVNFPRSDPTLQEQTPLWEAVTNAIAQSAGKWVSAKNKKSYLDPQDDAMNEMRRLCLEGRRDKDPVKRKTLSIALHTARQNTIVPEIITVTNRK